MKLTFFGAAQTVTGSKHLVQTVSGKRILLDCGLYQGRGGETDNMNRHFGFDPRSLDALVLSHAHIDHSGLIPRLVKEGFSGKIYCTPATRDLCELMLADSAYIQENDVEFMNKKRAKMGMPALDPLYSQKDVEKAMRLFCELDYHKTKAIGNDVEFMFTDAGHILGSAAVHLNIRETEQRYRRLTFTGDVGRPEDSILCSPEPFEQADVIICESTYGDRLHKEQGNVEERLFRIIYNTCLERKGKVIIPAFSLDRTQEVIYALDRMKEKRMLPPIKVFIDSPLSVNATQIMRDHEECFNENILEYMHRTDGEPFVFRDIHYITEVADSKRLNTYQEPCIIISASGMAEAGRVKHHIANNVGNGRNTILLVGYCTPSSLGGRLKAGNKTVGIFGEECAVRAQVETLEGYSAHADYEELINYLKCQDAAKVQQLFLVHGELPTMTHFKSLLHEQGFASVQIPALGEEFEC